jgi:hypothetical protein
MKRSDCGPEWSEPHLLSFVTDQSGTFLSIHADLAGITMLIDELEGLRELLLEDDCPHSHLFGAAMSSPQLTSTKFSDDTDEKNLVWHVKIYGWNEEWAMRHGLKPPST